MKSVKSLFVLWVILMFLVTFTCTLVYFVAQQSLRLGANDVPAQLAVETSIQLDKGKTAREAVPAEPIDLTQSLSPFVFVFDQNKNLLASSGVMGSKEPSYPKGVLDVVVQKGEDRVTWQPQPGLRFATVAIKYKDGYIVAGRSLHETENLIDKLGRDVLLAWTACAGFSAMALGVIAYFIKKVYPTLAKQ